MRIRLIDMLAACVSLAGLAIVAIPVMLRAAEEGKGLVCRDRLRQLGEAFARYESAQGGLPPRRTGFNDGNPYGGWGSQVLPYLAIEPTLEGDRFDPAFDFFDPRNRTIVETWIPAFVCPASPRERVVQVQSQASTKSLNPDKDSVYTSMASPTDFIASNGFLSGNAGFVSDTIARSARGGNQRQPLIDNDRSQLSSITDGLAGTLLLIEQAGRPNVWRLRHQRAGDGQFGLSPNARGAWAGWGSIAFGPACAETGDTPAKGDGSDCSVNCNNWHGLYGFHERGAGALFCDGSVRFIGLRLDPLTFAYLTLRDDGHLIHEDDFCVAE